MFNPDSPYSWQVGVFAINDDIDVAAHRYDGQITGYSSMLTRIPERAETVILTSNIGTRQMLLFIHQLQIWRPIRESEAFR